MLPSVTKIFLTKINEKTRASGHEFHLLAKKFGTKCSLLRVNSNGLFLNRYQNCYNWMPLKKSTWFWNSFVSSSAWSINSMILLYWNSTLFFICSRNQQVIPTTIKVVYVHIKVHTWPDTKSVMPNFKWIQSMVHPCLKYFPIHLISAML